MLKPYHYPFRMASGTATILVINNQDPTNPKILLGIRGKNVDVHPGKPSLPGGFMEAKWQGKKIKYKYPKFKELAGRFFNLEEDVVTPDHSGETLEQTAIRELSEELCTNFQESQLNQYYTCSEPGLDPRAHVINLCFWLEASQDQINSIEAGDDLEDVEWCDLDHLYSRTSDEMAFNHYDLTIRGIKHFKNQKIIDCLLSKVSRYDNS